jgi:hypothetical protein
LGDGYPDVLSSHRKLVRGAFSRFGGIEIDTQGDAFFFVFVRARDAVAAAVDVQRAHSVHNWPSDGRVRMRIGLHTGEPMMGDEGYLGLDVVRAARLCSSGRGGQVLLSETTRSLVGSSLPDGVSLFPLGERHLKDIDEPERIYELDIPGLASAGGLPVEPAAAEPTGTAPTDEARLGAKDPADDWEANITRRAEGFARRATESILARVERGFSNLFDGNSEFEVSGPSGLEGLASNADSLAKQIALDIRKAREDIDRSEE